MDLLGLRPHGEVRKLKIRSIKLIDRQLLSLTGEKLPKWLDPLLSPLNSFFDAVISALRNRLTFEDNFQCTKIETEFTSGTELRLSTGAKGTQRVIGVIPVYGQAVSITSWKLVLYQDETAGVTLTFTEGGSAICRLYLLLG